MVNVNEKIKGSLTTNGALTLVQKAKKDMKDGSYWYQLAFTNGEELMTLTAGKLGDELKLGTNYMLGLNFENGKLKIVDFKEVSK